MERFPFKLLLCASDIPGSLLVMLRELYKTFGGNVNSIRREIARNNEELLDIEPSIHMFTLKRCERFTPIYSQNVYTGYVLYMKPKYSFHFVLELYLSTNRRIKVADSNDNGINRDTKTEQEDRKRIAVMEVHMCINGHYYGIDLENLIKIIEAFSAPSCNETNENNGNMFIFCPRIFTQVKQGRKKDSEKEKKKGIIKYGLLMFPDENIDSESLNRIKCIHRVLTRLIADREQHRCAVRATCPIAYVRINENQFINLYSNEVTKYRLLKKRKVKKQKANPGKNKENHCTDATLYINFARDHECYSKDTTFTEYYGIITSGKEKKYSYINGVVNAMIICIHFTDNNYRELVHKYIEAITGKLEKSKILKDYVKNKLDKNIREDDEDECLYVYSCFFTCDDPRCEIMHSSLPTIVLGDRSGE